MSEVYVPSVETWGWWAESWAEVTQEAIVRVQESEWKARKMASQIFSSQKKNKQYALMLSFIFKYVEDEQLLAFVFEQMKHDSISLISLFGLFLPWLQERMDISAYKPLYGALWDNLSGRDRSLSAVISYYAEARKELAWLQSVSREVYIQMVRRWLDVWWVVDLASLTASDRTELDTALQKAIE